MIHIELINASIIKLHITDDYMNSDINEYFKFEDPQFKKSDYSTWDGIIRLYDKRSNHLSLGLLPVLLSFCKIRGHQVQLDEAFKHLDNPLSETDCKAYIETLKMPFVVSDNQTDMLHYFVNKSRVCAVSCTSSGKSASIYMTTRYYQSTLENPRILIIVPNVLLVKQLYNDYINYSVNNGYEVEKNLHKSCEGISPITDKPITIATWQTLNNIKDKSFFQKFDCVICDEVHLASGKSITGIFSKCTNAYIRFGLTGTLKTDALHPLQVSACVGEVKQFIKAKELIDIGQATKLKITMIGLEYSLDERLLLVNGDFGYKDEINFIIKHERRNKVIVDAALSLKGNSLFLFDRIEKHLDIVHKAILARIPPNKKVFVIDGSVKGSERDTIKAAIENGNDIILLASFGTVSTGVSIKKLHNMVLCHPTKSIVRTLQSLGRMLRLHDSKSVSRVFDLVDDFRVDAFVNHTFRHACKRLEYYQSEQHEVVHKSIVF